MTLASSVVLTSLSLVFLLAATGKLRHPVAFAKAVQDYALLPGPMTPPIAILLIGFECFIAASFLTGWLIEVAAPMATAILLGFSGAVAINLYRKRSVACGCFGDPEERISGRTIARLSLLIVGALFISGTTVRHLPAGAIMPLTARDARYGLEVVTLAVATNLVAMLLLALRQLRSIVWQGRQVRWHRRELADSSPLEVRGPKWT